MYLPETLDGSRNAHSRRPKKQAACFHLRQGLLEKMPRVTPGRDVVFLSISLKRIEEYWGLYWGPLFISLSLSSLPIVYKYGPIIWALVCNIEAPLVPAFYTPPALFRRQSPRCPRVQITPSRMPMNLHQPACLIWVHLVAGLLL